MYLIITEDGLVKMKLAPFIEKNKIDLSKFIEYAQYHLKGEFEEVDTPVLRKSRIYNVKMLAGKRKASKVNLVASYIYGADNHGHVIFGDVFLIFEPYDYGTKDRIMKPMDAEQMRILLNKIKDIHDMYYPDTEDFDIWE